MTERITAWWDGLSDRERIHAHGTALCVALFFFHYAWHSAWFVEDAAITFAYARNAALGDGFVTYVGGERVEGFSNPTWTLALMALRFVGVGPWVASKLLGAAAGALTLVLAGDWAKRMLPVGRWSALVPLLLAVSPQHVQWCASGLENSFFGLFLVAGGVLLLREVSEPGRRPWSALCFALLAMTRPEAPLYVAVFGLTGWAFAFRMGWRPALRWALSWGVLLLLPLIAWHGWRMWYFAWEFPNTYYAKLGETERFLPFSWDRRGWPYLRGWALSHARGFVLPLFFLGMTGLRGWRGWTGVVLSVITMVLVATGISWPSELSGGEAWDEPELLVRLRVVWLAAMVLLVPAVAVDRERDLPRVLAWLVGCTVVFFALYSGGDWMRGWRWLSMAIVPMSLLLAAGVHAVVSRLQARPRLALGSGIVLLATLLIADAINAYIVVAMPVTSPYDVHRRVQYMLGVKDRLNLDHATVMDVDMGAHLWWFGPEIVDMAGLVDVPIGHNHYDKPFITDYVYEWRQPTFAHVHASWASRTRMRQHDGWEDFVEIPPYPTSPRGQHDGNHVHQGAFVEPTPRTGGVARFGSPLVLQELDIPVKQVAPGGELYVELAWRRTARPDTPFRAHLFLASDDATHIAELPPAYDWLEFRRWRKGDKIIGRHRVALPADLPAGRYDVGLFVVGEGEEGELWPARELQSGPVTDDPRVVPGELRWVRNITVTDDATNRTAYDAAMAEVGTAAAEGRCDEAESRWRNERHYLPRGDAHRDRSEPAVRRQVADCLAERAADEPVEVAVQTLLASRRLDPRSPRLVAVGARLADAWAPEAYALQEAGEREAAISRYRQVMVADPTRAWDRRRLETLREQLIAERTEDPEEGVGG